MTHPLSLQQFGAIAVEMLEDDPDVTVTDVADRVGVSPSLVYKCWNAAHPDRRPSERGTGKFERICKVVLARLAEPASFSELLADVRARLPGMHGRTLHRALAKLMADGRIERHGKAGSGSPYARVKK